jgi:general secretion pathway protein L
MAETLVLRLEPADTGAGTWIVTDEQGRRVGVPGAGPIAMAAPAAAGRRVIVLAPAVDVLLTSVALPVRGAAKILRALPFALEEQIAEDIEALHFAAGRQQADGEITAAAVDREQLEGWLALLGEAGLDAQIICSEAEGAPAAPNHLNWLLDTERCIARSGDGLPVVLEISSVEEALRYGPEFPGEADAPKHLSVYLTEQAQAKYGEQLEALRTDIASVEIRRLPGGLLPHLAEGVVTREPINLLQGQFAPRTQLDRLWKPWRTAAALLAVLAVVMVGQEALRLMQLKQQEARLDAAIAETFQQALPGARMEDPRFQVERRLATLRGTGSAANESFLIALDTLGSALGEAPGIRLEAVSYRTGVLDLRLQAPSVDSLEQIRQAVAKDGRFTATIQQANQRADGVEGRIQLTGGGA